MKNCNKCKELKPIDAFHKDALQKDGFARRCKECKKLYSETYVKRPEVKAKKVVNRETIRQRNNNYVRNLLQQSVCKDCGEDNWIVLEFDHLQNKRCNISNSRTNHSIQTLQEELDKCDIVCANCHRVRTYSREFSWRVT